MEIQWMHIKINSLHKNCGKRPRIPPNHSLPFLSSLPSHPQLMLTEADSKIFLKMLGLRRKQFVKILKSLVSLFCFGSLQQMKILKFIKLKIELSFPAMIHYIT